MLFELGFLFGIGVRPAEAPVRGDAPQAEADRMVEVGETGCPPRPVSPPLPAYQAACEFVTFLRAEGLTGEIAWSGPRGIWNLYLWHCDEDGQTPIPSNDLGAALGRIVGKKQIRDRSKGKLRRLTVYTVEG